jgi:hypothetical protein
MASGDQKMRHVIGAAAMIWLGVAVAAGGETGGGSEPGVVVELYTSQGCSSCPPADDLFARLVKDPRVIPLALHVDYWDYIGWKDGFAKPQFTDRQKAYAHAIGSRTIYTPQMIVGGLDRVEGYQPDQVKALIRRHLEQPRAVALTLRRDGTTLSIEAEAKAAFDSPVRVQLVRYRPAETVDITRGENAGRLLTYHNIVTAWDALGDWSGETPLSLTVEAPGSDPAVVILQDHGPSAILAAARID